MAARFGTGRRFRPYAVTNYIIGCVGVGLGAVGAVVPIWSKDDSRCGGCRGTKKILNIALFISFVATTTVSLTGVHIYKLASVFFLLLNICHAFVYRRKLGTKRWLLLAAIVISFASGLLSMILDDFHIVLILHRAISIALVFFLASHIFVFRRRI